MLHSLLLVAALSAAPADVPKLVVLELTPGGGVPPDVASAVTEAVTQEVAVRGYFAPLSSREVQTLLGQERQREMLGCNEESSCLTELAGALGARFVLSGSLAKLGEAWQLSLQVLDSTRAQPLGRSVRLARSLETLRAQLAHAVAEATATPAPQPPSRLPALAAMGGGALTLVAGALVGQDALSRQRVLRSELEAGERSPGALRELSYYTQEQRSLGRQKTLSVVTLGAGAALVGLGVYLYPREGGPADAARPRAALVPTLGPAGRGVALVGVLP